MWAQWAMLSTTSCLDKGAAVFVVACPTLSTAAQWRSRRVTGEAILTDRRFALVWAVGYRA